MKVHPHCTTELRIMSTTWTNRSIGNGRDRNETRHLVSFYLGTTEVIVIGVLGRPEGTIDRRWTRTGYPPLPPFDLPVLGMHESVGDRRSR